MPAVVFPRKLFYAGLGLIGLAVGIGSAQTSITTAQFNNSRTAANLSETVLNQANVNTASFGKLYALPVDGNIFAQPLYVHGFPINGNPTNVLYLATMHNSIYAFDTDHPEHGPIFQVSLGPSVPMNTAGVCPDPLTGPELGILSTPALDLPSGTLYAVSATPDNAGGYVHRLFALDMRTGQNRFGSPAPISATVPGNGIDASGGFISLNNSTYIQRPGLVLANGNVYASFGSCGPDPEPYHGWLLGYNAATLQQTVVYNSTPNGYNGAVWQSGRAPVLDATGSFYFFTGNGSFNGISNFGNSLIKLSAAGTLLDWFAPANYAVLEQYDLDLAAGGPILMPDSNRLVGGGKEGVVYVVDPNAMGHLGPPIQQFQATQYCGTYTFTGCFQIHSLAYWNGTVPTLYVWGADDNLRAYTASGGIFNTVPSSQGSEIASYPGGILAVSSNGQQSGTGIVWATTPSGVLHAYQATNVSHELWNSNQNPGRDALGQFAKFGQPVIADGRVLVPTFSNAVVVYGLLLTPPAAPSNLNFAVNFNAVNQVSLTWTDTSDNETGFSIERSTDGVTFSQIATVSGNVTSYSDTNVAPFTYYYYRVRSFNSAGYSDPSNIVAYLVM